MRLQKSQPKTPWMFSMDRTVLKTPLGALEIVGSQKGIRSVTFTENPDDYDAGETPESLKECKRQLLSYFDGKLREFSIMLDPEGTPFQRKVWAQLLSIGYGSTTSYTEQTKSLGDLKAIRAVAGANAKNPIAIIIPCHRVVGADGKLTGYAGGLWRKRWLLEHENPPSQTSLF